MLTMKDFLDDEFTTNIYNIIAQYSDRHEPLDKILSDFHLRCNFYCDYIESYIGEYVYEQQKELNIHARKVDFKPLKDHFDFDTLVKIISHSQKYISYDLSTNIPKIYPEISVLFSMLTTTCQWYSEENPSEITYDIFNKIINLKTPFDDQRFEAFPIHVSENNKRGRDSCMLLKEKTGSMVSYYDEVSDSMMKKRADIGYRSNFLDAKLGVIIYFKNKPSIIISFNYDSEKNIFIHQIQCQYKDRGHYKIKGDWKLAAINYLREMFPEYKLHLIDGKTLSDLIYSGYSEVPNYLKPSADVFHKITKIYNELLPDFNNLFIKNGIKYRDISIST
jgi:hypothetical protein